MKKAVVVGAIVVLAIVGALIFLASNSHYAASPSEDAIASEEIPESADGAGGEPERGVFVAADIADTDEPSAPIASDRRNGVGGEDKSEDLIEESLPVSDATAGVWIRGYVTDLDGRGIADAEIFVGIELGKQAAFRTLSGVNGAFEIGGLAEAQYLIGARHAGYSPAYVRAVASRVPSDFARIVLSRGGTLEGFVTLEGEPLSECRIRVLHLVDFTSGQTDSRPNAEGFYRMEALTPGAYQVRLNVENPGLRSRPVRTFIRARVIIEAGRTTQADFDFQALTSSLEGWITVNGAAPKEADIMITLASEGEMEVRSRTEADSDGYYRFEELVSGHAQLRVHAESLEGWSLFDVTRNVSVPDGEQIFFNIELFSGSLIAGRLSGVPEGFEAGVLVLPGDVEVEELSLEVVADLFEIAAVVIDPMKSDEFQATGLERGTYTVLLLAIKQGVSDPFGEIIVGNYLVELKEGEEVFLEHSFE